MDFQNEWHGPKPSEDLINLLVSELCELLAEGLECPGDLVFHVVLPGDGTMICVWGDINCDSKFHAKRSKITKDDNGEFSRELENALLLSEVPNKAKNIKLVVNNDSD